MGKMIVAVLMLVVACESSDWMHKNKKTEEASGSGEREPAPEPVEKRDVVETPAASELRDKCERAIVASAKAATLKERLAVSPDLAERCEAYCKTTTAKKAVCEASRTQLAQTCPKDECDALCRGDRTDKQTKKLACQAATYAPTATQLLRGDRVSARWPENGLWYPGVVTAAYDDNTADVRWEDGTRTNGLAFTKIRLVKRPVGQTVASSNGGGSTSKGLVEGASCAGPGWQYVCGGRCTDVKSDTANCGSCGHRCDDGYTCDGSGTCRDASGRL